MPPDGPARRQIADLNTQAWELRSRQREQARRLAQQALELLERTGSAAEWLPEERAASLVVLGFVAKDEGRLDIALTHTHEALALLQASPDSAVGCDARLINVWTYIHLGDYAPALEFAAQALTMARSLGLRSREAQALDARAYIHLLVSDPAESLKDFASALEIARETRDQYRECFILNNRALALLADGQHEAALASGKESLRLAQEQGLITQIVNVPDTIAQVLMEMGQHAEAARYLEQALSQAEDRGPVVQTYILTNLGRACMGLRDPERAEALLRQALEAASHLDARAEQATCHKLLSEVLAGQGRVAEAFEHFKNFHALHEAVTGEKAMLRLNAVKVTHQVETAQRDAEIYRLRSAELQREVDEHKRTQAILERLATLDPLTELFNRRHFYTLAQREFERVLRYKRQVTALVLDIDYFKRINDLYGHAVGDQALLAVARLIRQSLRKVDIIGRVGGEEFAVLLPETPPSRGRDVAERIRTAVAKNPLAFEAGDLRLTLSIGVAGIADLASEEPITLDQLLQQADAALYQAKHSGRNRTVGG